MLSAAMSDDLPDPKRLPLEGELPGFDGATGWVNSGPVTPADLRGRPVVVQFWTLTCINWLRTLPYVRAWNERYASDGLTVVGVHSPEFEVEKEIANVERATREMGISYPVALDSDFRIWRAFDNRYWPALYVADADARIRYHHFGEGEYERSERVIQQLLGQAGAGDTASELSAPHPTGAEAPADWNDLRTPETYLGYDRASSFVSPTGTSYDAPHDYVAPPVLPLNDWGLGGRWTIGRQAAVPDEPHARIVFRFHARDLHLVMAPSTAPQTAPAGFTVSLDGQPPQNDHGVDTDPDGRGAVTEPRLYQLIRARGKVEARTFEIVFDEPGVRVYVFTFG
jgi:thiol-disulfide isomerase/thioredoxin